MQAIETDMSTILPPKAVGPEKSTTIRAPEALIDELDSIAEATGYSRTEVIVHFLKAGLELYKAEKKQKP